MSLSLSISVTGIEALAKDVEQYRAAVAAIGGTVIRISTNVAYAIYQHEGTRFMAGTRFYARAVEDIEPGVAPAIANALPHGPRAAVDAFVAQGFRIEARARTYTRVRTGQLRASHHTVVTRG